MSAPAVKVIFGIAAVLNSKPAGAFNTRDTPVPEPKSNLLPSEKTIGPSVRHPGVAAFAAISAEMFTPFVAGVIVTVAEAVRQAIKDPRPSAKDRPCARESHEQVGRLFWRKKRLTGCELQKKSLPPWVQVASKFRLSLCSDSVVVRSLCNSL